MPLGSGHGPSGGNVKSSRRKLSAARLRRVSGAVPNIEGGLVAPRLDDEHGGGNVQLERLGQLLFDALLGVPLVAAHPRAENPVGRRRAGAAGQGGECAQDGKRVAAKKVNGYLRLAAGEGEAAPAVGHRMAEVVVDTAGTLHMAAVAAVGEEEGHGQVAAVAMVLVLLVDNRVERASTLVDGVVAFAKADQGLTGLQGAGNLHGNQGAVAFLEPAHLEGQVESALGPAQPQFAAVRGMAQLQPRSGGKGEIVVFVG